jgi:hypothetical protein
MFRIDGVAFLPTTGISSHQCLLGCQTRSSTTTSGLLPNARLPICGLVTTPKRPLRIDAPGRLRGAPRPDCPNGQAWPVRASIPGPLQPYAGPGPTNFPALFSSLSPARPGCPAVTPHLPSVEATCWTEPHLCRPRFVFEKSSRQISSTRFMPTTHRDHKAVTR